MIRLLDTLVSDDLKEVCFACDLEKCKGACCIDGDAGAPLEEEEIALIEDHIEAIKLFMTPAGVKEVEEAGVFDYDAEGKFVTTLVEGGECVFVYSENGITRCAIEKAFREKAVPFPKPISCHLYPVRIRTTRTGDLVNYHEWHICRDALVRGKKENLPLYRFLEEALIRKYGKGWYDRLSTLLR